MTTVEVQPADLVPGREYLFVNRYSTERPFRSLIFVRHRRYIIEARRVSLAINLFSGPKGSKEVWGYPTNQYRYFEVVE